MQIKNIVNLTPTEFYNLSDDKKEKVISSITKKLASTPNVLINAMYNHVQKTVKHYITDFLIHDIQTLENETNNNYVWISHENGTFLVKLNHDFNNQLSDSKEWLEAVNYNYGNRKTTKVYLVNQEQNTLKKIKTIEETYKMFTCKYHDIDEAIKDKTKHVRGLEYWNVLQEVKKNSIDSVNELMDVIRRKTIKVV